MKSAETIGDNTCPSVSDLWCREGKRAVTRNCLKRLFALLIVTVCWFTWLARINK